MSAGGEERALYEVISRHGFSFLVGLPPSLVSMTTGTLPKIACWSLADSLKRAKRGEYLGGGGAFGLWVLWRT